MRGRVEVREKAGWSSPPVISLGMEKALINLTTNDPPRPGKRCQVK